MLLPADWLLQLFEDWLPTPWYNIILSSLFNIFVSLDYFYFFHYSSESFTKALKQSLISQSAGSPGPTP